MEFIVLVPVLWMIFMDLALAMEKTVNYRKEIIDFEFVAGEKDLILVPPLGGKYETLNEFLSEELSKEDYIKNEIQSLVLKRVEGWLNNQDKISLAISFAIYVRFYNQKLSPNEQKTKVNTFRTICLLKLVELAEKWKLKTLLIVLGHP